MIINLLVS